MCKVNKFLCNLGCVVLVAFALLEIRTCSPVDGFVDAVKNRLDDNSPRDVRPNSFDGHPRSSSNLTATKSWSPSGTTREQRRARGCGMNERSSTRILGGKPAVDGEWPWMVAILRGDGTQHCGGVLITDRHVLTAAHCLQQLKKRDIIARLGEYDFSQPSGSRTLDFRVTDVRIHEDFDYSTYENDIAILRIHRPTPFNTYIWPICLPPVGTTFENKMAVVTGWGTQYYGGSGSDVLLEVSVPVWSHRTCQSSLPYHIPESIMCAGDFKGGRDACQGDSGGPLVHQLANGRWVNIGIVSWGIRCGEPGQPGVYTRVSSYLDWIFANAIF